MMHPTDTKKTTTSPIETAPPAHTAIKNLCDDLARNMHTPVHDLTVLDEQVQILNALFNATLAEQLDISPRKCEYREARNKGWLELALKIQKQCMETVRTRQSAEYMDALRNMHTVKLRSLPAITEKAAPDSGDLGHE